jgi:hypothetical protein
MIRGDPIFMILEIPLLRIAAIFTGRAAGARSPEPVDSTMIVAAAATTTREAAAKRRWWSPNPSMARPDVVPAAR